MLADGTGHKLEIYRLLCLGEPSGDIEVEARHHTLCPDAQVGRHGDEKLQLGGCHRCAQPEVGGGSGEPGQEKRLCLPRREPIQPRAIAVEQAVAPGRAAHAVDEDSRGAQGVDVPVDRAKRNLALVGEGLRSIMPPSRERR